MKSSEQMNAIIVKMPGKSEQLKLSKVPKPIPSAKELLIKVEATALNRADILQRQGKYPPPKGASETLGLEVSGVVTEMGPEVTKYKEGDKVFGLVPGGGYAEYCVIHESMANKIPEILSFEEAAAIPEVFLTAYQALITLAKLKKEEAVLIHAGASGVGTAGIQIAKEIGAKVFVTASKSKHHICIKLGAEKAIDYKNENFAEKILDFTHGNGVNVIIDFISAPYVKDNIKSLAIDGRLVILATLGGGLVEEFDLRQILIKRLSVIGSTLRSRSLDYQINLNSNFINFAFEKFNNQKFKPIIDKIYDWKDVAEAHEYMEANKNIGKIVLKITQ